MSQDATDVSPPGPPIVLPCREVSCKKDSTGVIEDATDRDPLSHFPVGRFHATSL